MLSPWKDKCHKRLKNDSHHTAELEQSRTCYFLPLSSSAAKKAARQSSRVTMGPQNQVGIHETTNLFIQKETVTKMHESDTGPSNDLYVAAVNADIKHVIKALFKLSL